MECGFTDPVAYLCVTYNSRTLKGPNGKKWN